MEINKSFKKIQNRRMVLSLMPPRKNRMPSPDYVEQSVFYFADGQFVMWPVTMWSDGKEEEYTAIWMSGFEKPFAVMESVETINEFLFGEHEDGQA